MTWESAHTTTRRAAEVLVAVLVLAVVAFQPPASALDGPVVASKGSDCRAIASNPRAVTIIGDSITVQSFDEITAVFNAAGRPVCIDAQSGRQTSQAVPDMAALRRAGELSPTVILALGTNDYLTPNATFNKAAQQVIGLSYPRRTVWDVGYRSTDPKNSARIEGLVGEWDNAIERVTSARWGSVVKALPQYIGPDGIHPTEEGRTVYAQFLLVSVGG